MDFSRDALGHRTPLPKAPAGWTPPGGRNCQRRLTDCQEAPVRRPRDMTHHNETRPPVSKLDVLMTLPETVELSVQWIKELVDELFADSQPVYLTVEEVATQRRLAAETVRRHCRANLSTVEGRIKVGKRWLIPVPGQRTALAEKGQTPGKNH